MVFVTNNKVIENNEGEPETHLNRGIEEGPPCNLNEYLTGKMDVAPGSIYTKLRERHV